MSVAESQRSLLALLASKYNWRSHIKMISVSNRCDFSPPATVTRKRGNTTSKKNKAAISPDLFEESISPQFMILSNPATPICEQTSDAGFSDTESISGTPIYAQECSKTSKLGYPFIDKENEPPSTNKISNATLPVVQKKDQSDEEFDDECEWNSESEELDALVDSESEEDGSVGDEDFIVADSTDESEEESQHVELTLDSESEPTSPLKNLSSKRSRQSLANMKSFSRKRAQLSVDMYAKYNELVFKSQLPHDLPIVWSKTLLTTAGRAFTSPRNRTASKIELSIKVVDTPNRLRDTLLHEMCHVAVNTIGMYSPNVKPHGNEFFRWANKVNFHVAGAVTGACHSYDIHKPHKFSCVNPDCGVAFFRHSKKGLDIEGYVKSNMYFYTHGCTLLITCT